MGVGTSGLSLVGERVLRTLFIFLRAAETTFMVVLAINLALYYEDHDSVLAHGMPLRQQQDECS